MRPLLVLAALAALAPACWDQSREQREAAESELRGERLRRVRKARNRDRYKQQWHDRYRRQIARATGMPVAPATPPSTTPPPTCDPWTEFHRRVQTSHHRSQFAEAAQLVLRPLGAGQVQDAGGWLQRFAFSVRMHPADEPSLGRKGARGELELELRWVPLCPTGRVVVRTETLRLRLARRAGGRPPKPVRPQQRRRRWTVPVGVPVNLLLDPTRGTLAPPRRGASSPPPAVGLWEITEARFPGRPRLKRLAQPTTRFGPRLAQLHAVEVACAAPGGTCRFLTRAQGYRETPLTLGDMLKLAAPITRRGQARQLFAILLALKYPRCQSRGQRARGKTHPCLRPGRSFEGDACAYWRALNGFANRLRLASLAQRMVARQVMTCPGARRRVLRVEATFRKNGDFQLRETDLTSRSAEFEAAIQRLAK